jgi:hypothetical protein
LTVKELVKELGHLENNITILKQSVNYQNKTVGILVQWTDDVRTDDTKTADDTMTAEPVLVPCFPSTPISDLDAVWMDDESLWTDYDTTIEVLQKIHRKSNKKIPCEPVFRIKENEMVIGILTNTDQFLLTVPPIKDDREDSLRTLERSNYIMADTDLMTQKEESEEEQKMVDNIQLETQFYISFRNTVRIVLNMYKHRKLRDKIINLYYDSNNSYMDKLKKIESRLKEITKDVIIFNDYDESVLKDLKHIYSCQTDCDKKKYCLLKDDGKICQLVLPSKNLQDKSESNNTIYYARLADELLRHKRIRSTLLYPETHMNVDSDDYKISKNEILLPQSSISVEYYKGLVPFSSEKYGRKKTFESANAKVQVPSKKNVWLNEIKKE